MTAHSRRRKVTKRVKSKKGPLLKYIFQTKNGIDIVAAHSIEEAAVIFKETHGYEGTPKELSEVEALPNQSQEELKLKEN